MSSRIKVWNSAYNAFISQDSFLSNTCNNESAKKKECDTDKMRNNEENPQMNTYINKLVKKLKSIAVHKNTVCSTDRKDSGTTEVDKGWAWVVALAAFTAHLFTLGFVYSIGVYYNVFLEVFEESKGLTAWISSVNFGILCAVGPLASILISKYGCRTTMLCGTILSTAGLVTSAFATDVHTMLASLGIVAGAGFGMVFTTGVVIVGLYFNRYRTLVMGLSMSGAGFGTLVYPWLSKHLINYYGWRGALMIAAAINFQICICAMMIPSKPPLIQVIDKETTLDDLKIKSVKIEKPLCKALNLDLFNDMAYISLCLNCTLSTFSLSMVLTHISAYTHSMELGKNSGDLMISAFGVSNLLGRIGLGIFGQLDFVNVPLLFMASYFIAGVAIIICGVWITLPGIAICICTFGFFSGAFGPLLSEVTCLVVGVGRFSHGYGYLLLFMAIGTVLGAPAAGTLYDVTQFYPASFYLGGCSLVLSAIIMLPTYRRMNKKQKMDIDHIVYIEPSTEDNHVVELLVSTV